MDYMFPSRTNDNLCLTTSDNLSSQEADSPNVFLQFPSSFLDDMDTSNLHHHHLSTTTTDHVVATTTTTQINNPLKFNTTTSTSTSTSNTERLASKLKCSTVRKKRSAGKKDRHSKIHTAQGLRDRRMRLSVHTARKFFDLNDMLGFDKASKTIEWLFSKSKKAIDEVTTETTLQLQPDDDAVVISGENNNEIDESPNLSATESAAEKDENLELQVVDDDDQQIIEVENYSSSRSKPILESYPMVTELSGKEARARSELIERSTRDRSSILENNNNNNNHVEKLKQLFEADPRINFHQSQLAGFLENHHQHNMEDQSSSGSYPLEFSNTYHFLKHLHLDNTSRVIRNTDHDHTNYVGNINTTAIPAATNILPSSIYHDYNKTVITEPPAGWLNSKNTFLGFLGGWDNSENNSRSILENNNGSINVPPLINGSTIISRENTGIISSNYRNFHSQNQSGH